MTERQETVLLSLGRDTIHTVALAASPRRSPLPLRAKAQSEPSARRTGCPPGTLGASLTPHARIFNRGGIRTCHADRSCPPSAGRHGAPPCSPSSSPA